MRPSPHGGGTKLERALCEELGRQEVPHEHGSLRFRIRLASGENAPYRPALVVRRGSILFLLEPLPSPIDPARIAMIERFLEQHSPEIVFIAVAAREDVSRLPPTSYDEAYPDDDLARVVARVRSQDPEGIVDPFAKPPREEGTR